MRQTYGFRTEQKKTIKIRQRFPFLSHKCFYRIIYIIFIEIKHLRINYLDDGRPSGQMCKTDVQW